MANRIFYYDVLKSDIYDVQGNLIGNNNVSVYLDNLDNIEMHYITEPSTADPSTWTKWTALAGLPTIASSVAVDDNVKHAIKGISNAVITSLTTTIQAVVEETTVVNPTGNLQITDNSGNKYTFPYTSRTAVSSTLYEFTVTNPLTTETIPSGCVVRIPEALLMKAEGDDIDESDAANGIFVFQLYALSYKILESLDYSNSESLSARLQHKIMSGGNTVYTFEFVYEIKNLIDFGNEAEVPAVETDTYATKAYVISVASLPLEYEYSVDGVSGWHGVLDAFDDLYYHTRPSGSGGAFSASQLVPYGASGQQGASGIGLPGEDGSSVLFASGLPASGLGNDGDSYIDGETFDFYHKDSDMWTLVGSLKAPSGGSGDLVNPMTTQGDLIIGGVSGTPERLPIGASGQFLKVNDSGTGFDYVDMSASNGGMWTLVERWTASQTETSKTFSSLNGNTDKSYKVIIRLNAGSSNTEPLLRFNGDTSSSNYRHRWWTSNSGGTAQVQGISCGTSTTSGDIAYHEVVIDALSDKYRVTKGNSVCGVNSGAVAENAFIGGVWYNTVDEITAITLTATSFAAGTVIELWKLSSNNSMNELGMDNPMLAEGDIIYGSASGIPERLVKGTAGQVLTMNAEATIPEWQTPSGSTGGGMWTLVERWEPSGTANGYTFSNLDGNSDRRYKIVVARLVAANSPSNIEVLIRPNNDSGTNYQYFPFESNGSSVTTTSVTTYTGMSIAYFPSSPAGAYETAELFAKVGDYRGMLSQFMRISGTSLNAGGSKYQIWKNTTDNITSLVVVTASGSNHFGVGTSIELWKLNG